MAKHLGLVPIPGSQVVAHGLRFTAEDTAGRRNKIGTVRIARVEPDPAGADVARPRSPSRRRPSVTELSAEDQKLVTLARATRARTGGRRGRRRPRLRRPHLRRRHRRRCPPSRSPRSASASPWPSRRAPAGSRPRSCWATGEQVSPLDLDVLRDFAGPGVIVHVGDPRGAVSSSTTT